MSLTMREGMMKKFSGEDAWAEAFDYCREADKPICVLVHGTKYKLFPSGRAENLETGEVS